MTDVKRLLDEATPLPWRLHPSRVGPRGGYHPPYIDGAPSYGWSNGWDVATILTPREGVDSHIDPDHDAALIVHAVNNLPAYEEAVEALALTIEQGEMLLKARHDSAHNGDIVNLGPFDKCSICAGAFAEGRAALARLRGDA